tara:strand:- start:2872 stop:3441 length:570 start_codon:yes stop_codon:yes gene_type:complete
MRIINIVVGIALLLTSASVSARSPYVINGLHTDLALGEARTQAEKLGGTCRNVPSRPNDVSKNVQCEFSHCDPAHSAGCEQTQPARAGLMFASHPILSIGLTAPGEAAALTQIVMVYEGDTERVARDLIATFGGTETEGAPTDEASWTNARRWSWRQGHYRMGLMDSPQLIILSSDLAPTAADSAQASH